MTAADSFPYKVELHVHLDGSVRLSTLFEVAKAKNFPLPHNTVEELKEDVCVYHAHSLLKVLSSFVIFMPIIAGDREIINRLAYEFCEDCSRSNTKYVEARYSPHLLSNNEANPEYALECGDLTPREVVQIVNKAFKAGAKDFNIRIKSILCCMRHRPDWSAEVVRLADEFRTDGVVGVDIAGASGYEDDIEKIVPQHKEAFKRAKELGLHITAHAGEAGPAAKVKESLDELFAERIGHGYRTPEDDDVYRDVIERRIHLEVCPHSSVRTGAVSENLLDHPAVRFAADGVNFSINTDDPLVFDSRLEDDYDAAGEMGFTDNQIIKTIFNAAESCFAPEDEKKEILREIEAAYGPKSNYIS